jgi:gamma-glutamyltranspeptidase/glutathione hydrolase
MAPPKPPPVDSELIDPDSFEARQPQRIAASRHGMVATQHYEATRAGVEMLADGGNAIDAAVAAALALAVCEPNASGLGGQTMILLYLARAGRTVALDGSSHAPHRAIPGTVSGKERLRGYKATTVPSTPRVLAYVLDHYGTLPWSRVIEPAIRLAKEGLLITPLQRALAKRESRHLRKQTAAHCFLKDGRRPYRAGDRFRQPVLAETLSQLALKGVDDFYTGQIAEMIHQDMVNRGGLIRKDDLAQMRPPIERRPVACWFDGMRVMTFPPPGAGRTLIEMLNIISHLPKKYRNLDRPQQALMLARIMRRAYRDRRDRPYDPQFYAQVSDRKMISFEYARKIARRLRTGGETTHLSVMDRGGNVVGLTQSIERVYGACVVTDGLGFLYNNYMSAFEHTDIGHPYYLRPNAVPWASVAPTIVFRGRKPWLVIGSPGSERITASIFQVLLRLEKETPLEAVDAPRLYCNYRGKVSLEAPRMRDDIPQVLEEHGFSIDARNAYSFYLGCVQLVLREDDMLIGVADPRRDGAAGGPRK